MGKPGVYDPFSFLVISKLSFHPSYMASKPQSACCVMSVCISWLVIGSSHFQIFLPPLQDVPETISKNPVFEIEGSGFFDMTRLEVGLNS